MSFYRTYRPQTVSEIDNVAVRNQLLELLSKDTSHLPHAFLFTGPRGAGKTTAARLIAKIFNCPKSSKKGPCGSCDQCTTIATGRNLDVLELDAASNRGIDEIRAIRDAINLAPTSAKYKIYIIDEVHMLTTEAFNALLKTLEEPPSHAVFVLATTDPQKVPATIKSRCVGISFHRATQEELLHALHRIVEAEKISIDEDALALLASSVDGAFRDAVKLLEQVSFHEGVITRDVIGHMLSITSSASLEEFVSVLESRDAKKSLTYISEIVKNGADCKLFLTDVLKFLEKKLIAEVSDGKNYETTKDMIKALSGVYGLQKVSPIPELPLEVAIVEFCHPPSVISVAPVIPGLTRNLSDKTGSRLEGRDDKDVVKSEETPSPAAPISLGLLTLEKLTSHWLDFIEALKPLNHSVAGVMRSARPKSVEHGIVIIEAFYPFHKDKLSESKAKDIQIDVLKRLFGEKVKVEIVLGKK